VDTELPTSKSWLVDANDVLEGLLCDYRKRLVVAPMLTKSITSCVIAIAGEIFGSYFTASVRRLPVQISPRRIAVFGLYGLAVTGPILHLWYGLLENIVGKVIVTPSISRTALKLFIDRVIFGPPFVLLTVFFLQFLQTLSTSKTLDYIRRSYVAVLLMNQKIWVVAQTVNFAVIPVELQVLFVNAVAIGWNTYLSLAS
jgi:hypothetical protein